MSIRIPRQPAADPAQTAALTPLVREIARRCGITPDAVQRAVIRHWATARTAADSTDTRDRNRT